MTEEIRLQAQTRSNQISGLDIGHAAKPVEKNQQADEGN